MGTGFFLAIVFSCLVVPQLADKIGRKKIFVGGLWLHTVSLALLITVCHSIQFAFVLLVFQGISAVAKAYVGYVYLLELMPLKQQVFVGSFIFVVDGFTMILVSLVFAFVTTQWRPF